MAITPAKNAQYSRFATEANYLPWSTDEVFQDIYAKIKPNTMVDIYRCYELWTLVDQAAKLPGDILEIGVWRGGTGCLMAKRAQLVNSPAQVFLCDTFRGVVKVSERDPHYKEGWHATPRQYVDELAAQLGTNNVQVLSGVFPDKTGKTIQDRKFSLCHIDVDIYLSALHIVEWVWPRMPIGGILVFDDYGFAAHDGITDLVNERAHLPGNLTLYNLNGHGLVIKVAA